MCGRLLLAGLLWVGLGAVRAESRPYFNDLKAPETVEDLQKIQAGMQEILPRIRAATVCLQVGDGSGSGVIVSPEGLVLTAAHVTGGVGKEVTVVLEDGTELKGESLGLHSETDAAMLQLQGEGPFPYVEIDREDGTRLGDWVIALGHSGGFDQARGVVVRLGRLVRVAENTEQSDCILIGGDSGGPLFDFSGKVIAIHSRVGKSKEESMHVPLRTFLAHWEEMLNQAFIGEGPFAQKAVKGSGFLGLGTEDSAEGLRVNKVLEESTAARLGLMVGDVIVSLNEEEVPDRERLRELLAELAADEKVSIRWRRGGEDMTGEARLGKRP